MTDGDDAPVIDDSGAILSIEHGDGSITVSLDGRPLNDPAPSKPLAWFANLADQIPQDQLGIIADDLLRGIEDDKRSRQEWVQSRAQGIKLLGLKVEIPNTQAGTADGAPVEGMSKVRHPLLLEHVLRFQANARSELLPTDGPVKVRNDATGETGAEDVLADTLEGDLNHYLTAVATEYYPDTDRMLLMLGFGGTSFKKVYFCPLRNRPVSESVDANDLIVNNAATDLKNAKRVTHRVSMRPSTVKRLQILGVYRAVALGTPVAPETDPAKREEDAQQGVSASTDNPLDRDREIYECYCELDIPSFEHKKDGAPTGLEIPYRVTIDVSSREILSIVRNYDEDTQELPEARTTFVKYTYIPGLGFYDIGLLHILGNTTNAITAAWRELLDSGMFANFPGFLIAKAGTRQNTNIFRVPPGGGAPVDTQGLPIKDAVMPLPYSAQGMPALMQLVEAMEATAGRLGVAGEPPTGEGRADVPVGTILALIEQATKVENAVHKRLHAAQAEEFKLLVECFREHPEAFVQTSGKRSSEQWDEKKFLTALDSYELVPQADPNTASHTQRLMKVMALSQAAQQSPQIFNPLAVAQAALQAMGWANPAEFLNTQPMPDPKTIDAQTKAKSEGAKAQAATTTANARMLEAQTNARQPQEPAAGAPPWRRPACRDTRR